MKSALFFLRMAWTTLLSSLSALIRRILGLNLLSSKIDAAKSRSADMHDFIPQMVNLADIDEETATCDLPECKNTSAMKCCACEIAKYCSVNCQKRHWNVGHKFLCEICQTIKNIDVTENSEFAGAVHKDDIAVVDQLIEKLNEKLTLMCNSNNMTRSAIDMSKKIIRITQLNLDGLSELHCLQRVGLNIAKHCGIVIAPLLLEFGTKAKINEAEEFLFIAKKLSSLCKKQSTESKLYAVQITSHMGLVHRLRGRYDAAISCFEDAMKQLQSIPDDGNNSAILVKVYLMERHADSLMMVPKFEQALEVLTQAHILSRDRLGPSESSTHSTTVSRAHVMFALGDFATAESTCRSAVKGLLRYGKGVTGTATKSTAAGNGSIGTTTMIRAAGNCFKDTTTMLLAAGLLLILADVNYRGRCRPQKEVLIDAEKLARKCLKLLDDVTDPTDEISERSWECLLLLNKLTMQLHAYSPSHSQESEQFLLREVTVRLHCRNEFNSEKESQLARAIESYLVFRLQRTSKLSLSKQCDASFSEYMDVAAGIRRNQARSNATTVFGRLFN